jgi:hypothetical protein
MDNKIILNFEQIKLPELKEEKIKGKEYISYGVNNLYPNFLYELYNNCSDHQSIIDGIVAYTIGNGITTTNQQLDSFFKKVNEYDETINDISYKLQYDYEIFGGFCFLVTPNKIGGLYSIEYINFMNVRLSENEQNVYYSEKGWDKWGVKATEYPIFNPKNVNKKSIFYYNGHKTRGIYPIPLYNGALKSIMTLIEIDNFHLNNVANGFQPSTIINFNNGIPTIEQMEEIERKINNKFSGTSGKKLLINFAESKDKGAEIVKLDMDNFGDMFSNLFKTTQNTIFTAHKITSPALFGIKQEGTGFSKTEFMESFDIFNNTVIKSRQNNLISVLYNFFKYYYTITKSDIVINPYVLKNNE